jgi:hypothetical protein
MSPKMGTATIKLSSRAFSLSKLISMSAVVGLLIPGTKVQADSISPAITGDGRSYSKEAPNEAFYGSGMSGRMSEASALRFDGEQDTVSQKYDAAIRKLAKAVELDPNDPTGHVLYARALSKKIDATKGKVPLATIEEAIEEWKTIWHHDADVFEQWEGHKQVRHLDKVAKAIKKGTRVPSPLVAGRSPF